VSYRRRTRDEHLFEEGPKRILCLDGGGLRGAFTLGVLRELEDFLRKRHGGDPDFRLADYFDLVAGTSTGAIIAATLASGMSVEEVYAYYRDMGPEVFRKATGLGSAARAKGVFRPRYEQKALEKWLRSAVGADTRLGDEAIRTGLLIVTKRVDTHSVWPIGNNPRGRYFAAEEGDEHVPNREYPIWKLLRASTAAPTYFEPEPLEIGDRQGEFLDGGVSPFNDPSVQALMYTTLKGYRVGWPVGDDNLLLVSVGTGSFDGPRGVPYVPRADGFNTAMVGLFSLLSDTQVLARTLMQWMSRSPMPSQIDSEIGDLSDDLLGDRALLSYVRYDMNLTRAGLAPLRAEGVLEHVTDAQVDTLHEMDNPGNSELLWTLGRMRGRTAIQDDHLPARFDLDTHT